jgi:hypothetical protein
MKELTIEEKAKRYDEAIELAKEINDEQRAQPFNVMIRLFPEIKESDDEMIRKELLSSFKCIMTDADKDELWYGLPYNDIITWLEKQGKKHLINYDDAEKEKADFVGDGFIECHADFLDFKEGNTYWLEYIGDDMYNVRSDNLLGKTYHITPCQLYTVFKKLTWLEKQGSEHNWCHHKVDLSDYSEEYRKAYYDGWNNCNMQHSQCMSELDDVVKCLINGMKFYYEDNEEATCGTGKWSMPVKHIIEVLEKQGGYLRLVKQKLVDKVEPKFHEGDWVLNNVCFPVQIASIEDGMYVFTEGDALSASFVDENYHLWTIQDAEDGDVLVNGNEIVIFKENNFNQKDLSGCMFVHCSLLNKNGYWYTIGGINPSNYVPATKEQRDTLMKAMTDAGYTFDFEKKELMIVIKC